MTFRRIAAMVPALAAALSAATHTVSKDGRGAFAAIQAAVDRAAPYDEIVILDSATYEEQVTLRSPLHHVALYASNGGARKPVIKWADKENTGPRTCQEALDTAKLTFDKNGALRLIGVRDIRVEGISIDGGGAAPFGNLGIWGNGVDCNGQLYPLFHGNGALVLFQTSHVSIIGCEIANAYFGAYIKDRDMLGPFAGRGKEYATHPFARIASGNHIFAGNSIHHNTWGVFMESAWGLGSNFRDNLFWENHHATPEAEAAVRAMSSEGSNQPGGAFLFKDAQHSSMTLMNNTFWRDFLKLAAGYRGGAQHLIVNNVFAEPNIAWTKNKAFGNSFMALDPFFPKRMKSNAYAGQAENPVMDSLSVTASQFDTAEQKQVMVQRTVYSSKTVRIMNQFPALTPDTSSLPIDLPLSTGVKHVRVALPSAIYPGTAWKGGAAPLDFSAADQNRWLEAGFLSVRPGDPDFLSLKPDSRAVLGTGWSGLPYPDAAGIPAGPGALPASARPEARIRIVPLAPVLMESGPISQMVLRFAVQALKGGPAANAPPPVLSYLRLERKLPTNPTSFGGQSNLAVPEAEALPIPATPLHFGYNEIKLASSGSSADSNALGFVEMAVQAMGALSNVAQFPILPLASRFTVEALDETRDDLPASGFAAGKSFRLRIASADPGPVIGPLHLSLATGAKLKFLDPANADSAGSIAAPLPFTARVQFTETPDDGVELIWVSAYADSSQRVTGYGQSRALVFGDKPSSMARGTRRPAQPPSDPWKRRNLMGRKLAPR